jgi:predicted DsbA family dithiol-disulfide isomerase
VDNAKPGLTGENRGYRHALVATPTGKSTMPALKIDFISDVACPWCAIGLQSLETAVERIGRSVQVEWHFQPFELNPQMGPEGADAAEYLRNKYGLTDVQLAQNQQNLRARGVAVGFEFGPRLRVWNTFDAHRLLYWAGKEGPRGSQRALKHALLSAYHTLGRNPGATDVLLELAATVRLDVSRARAILASDEFAPEVRAAELRWQQVGIRAVPAVVINDRHLIQGGQPPEVFEQTLRQLSGESAWATFDGA